MIWEESEMYEVTFTVPVPVPTTVTPSEMLVVDAVIVEEYDA
jgi:hypothetical protein